MTKTQLVAGWLSVLTLANCKPTPAGDRNSQESSVALVGTPTITYRVVPSSTDSDSGNYASVVTIPVTAATAVRDTSTPAPDLECAPTVVSSRDTIALRMFVPHGEYLVVMQPDSTMFFLVYPHREEAGDRALASSDAFVQMPTIRFGADLMARPQKSGRDTLERIFRAPGNYVVLVGHHLESERASDIRKCTVRFVSGK